MYGKIIAQGLRCRLPLFYFPLCNSLSLFSIVESVKSAKGFNYHITSSMASQAILQTLWHYEIKSECWSKRDLIVQKRTILVSAYFFFSKCFENLPVFDTSGYCGEQIVVVKSLQPLKNSQIQRGGT